LTQQLFPQLDRVLKDEVKRAVEELFGKPHRDLETLLVRIADAAAARALDNYVEQNSLTSRWRDPAIGGRLLIPVPEAAHMAGVGVSTMWDLIRQGRVETVSLSRRRLIVVESLHRLVEERREAAKEPLASPPVGRGRRPREALTAN